ncbi:MAG: mechanosensitive ion channel family protein [Puniceicoccaceae bacterium]
MNPSIVNLESSFNLWYRSLSLLEPFIALALLTAAYFGARVIKSFFTKLAQRSTETNHAILASTFESFASSVPLFARLLGVWSALATLNLLDFFPRILGSVGSILLVFGIARIVFGLCSVFEKWFLYVLQSQGDGLDVALAALVRRVLQALVVLFAGFEIYRAISGQPPSAIIASLGVGGLALGLAAQDSIKHFFGSLVILADKPFKVGDRIIVGDYDGTVIDIGLRSSQLRLLDGQVACMPNDFLANNPIRNVSRRPNIRRIINLSLTYDTPPEKILEARSIVEELLDNHEGMAPELTPKVYFDNFGQAHLNLFIIYWYHPADWWAYNAMSQKFNLAVLERFNKAGISFAFPTQTLFLANDPRNPLTDHGAQGGT